MTNIIYNSKKSEKFKNQNHELKQPYYNRMQKNKMKKNLVKKIDERKEILNLLTNPGYKPMVFYYPYESSVNLTAGKDQKPIFYNALNVYNKR